MTIDLIKNRCKEVNCKYMHEYGCIAPKEIKRKIANDGEGITVMINDNGKFIIYYIDIMCCEKWSN